MLIIDEEDVTGALEELAIKGFCFHGSSKLVNGPLTPQQAYDEVKESGNREAVYMTINPLLAEFTALYGGADVGQRKNSCAMTIDDGKVSYPGKQFFAVEKIEGIADIGYIYVFDKKTPGFEEANGEILSYMPIEPMFAIKIKKEDFKYPIEEIDI